MEIFRTKILFPALLLLQVEALASTLYLGDRFFVENFLIRIFGPTARPITFRNVIQQSNVFGGPCDIYQNVMVADSSGRPTSVDPRAFCQGGINDFKLPIHGERGPLRTAWLMKTCHEITDQNAAIEFALRQIGGSVIKAEINQLNISRAYRLFYPNEKLQEGVLEKIMEIEGLKLKNDEKWRIILLSFCLTQNWQVL